ncbi:hypothetical protein PT043_09030, partial [Erysipelothrix rhusiopathiae]|nr:hypothetical protein [Erysipelothrix rhusiopathiae]
NSCFSLFRTLISSPTLKRSTGSSSSKVSTYLGILRLKSFSSIRFDGFTDAWKQEKLGNLGKVYTGNTPPTADLENWTYDKEG